MTDRGTRRDSQQPGRPDHAQGAEYSNMVLPALQAQHRQQERNPEANDGQHVDSVPALSKVWQVPVRLLVRDGDTKAKGQGYGIGLLLEELGLAKALRDGLDLLRHGRGSGDARFFWLIPRLGSIYLGRVLRLYRRPGCKSEWTREIAVQPFDSLRDRKSPSQRSMGLVLGGDGVCSRESGKVACWRNGLWFVRREGGCEQG